MLRAMVFIDFENFNIAKMNYYRRLQQQAAADGSSAEHAPAPLSRIMPRIDYNVMPQAVVQRLAAEHTLVKTFLFAPKPDAFLMQDERRVKTYDWIRGLKNQNRFAVIEGTHSARPVSGDPQTMNIAQSDSYYVVEKGTDINLATHLLTKAFHNAYDTAVIMSCDTDYIPVIDILNTIGKSVAVVGVQGQNLLRFKHHSDQQILLDDDFFQSCIRT